MLLKPFGEERVRIALARARTFLSGSSKRIFQDQMAALLSATAAHKANCLLVKDKDRVLVLRPHEIDWVEAEGNYVRLHVGKESYLLRETIGALEEQLDRRKFLRIHRSTIVNIDRIQELQPWFHGEFRVILRNGTALMLSRTHREKLQELLGKPI